MGKIFIYSTIFPNMTYYTPIDAGTCAENFDVVLFGFGWKIREIKPLKVENVCFLCFFLTLQRYISLTMHFTMGTIWVQINLLLILRRTSPILLKSVQNSPSYGQKTENSFDIKSNKFRNYLYFY